MLHYDSDGAKLHQNGYRWRMLAMIGLNLPIAEVSIHQYDECDDCPFFYSPSLLQTILKWPLWLAKVTKTAEFPATFGNFVP